MSQITPSLSGRLQRVLLSPGFLIGLVALLFNDFYLKQEYGNTFTGKLSDFAGLFIFPLFVSSFFPRLRLPIYIGVATAFLFWKAPISEVLVTVWNSLGVFPVGRTLDYTDYIALVVLPASYTYFQFIMAKTKLVTDWKRVAVGFSLAISVFAFTATTLTKDRTIILEDQYKIREGHDEVEARLRRNDWVKSLTVQRDDEVFANYPQVEADRKTYFFTVLLDRPTCDSNNTIMSFLIQEEESLSLLRGIDIKFECSAYESASNINGLDRSYVDHARSLFLQDILTQLTKIEDK